MIIVDTNVVSELMRPTPAPTVVRWLRSQSTTNLYTTSITLAEILYGLRRLSDGQRKALLSATATEIFTRFGDHVLPFDTDAANCYAQIVDGRDRLGLPIDGFDAQIAAICHARGAQIATRNTKDFQHTGLQLINPWESTHLP